MSSRRAAFAFIAVCQSTHPALPEVCPPAVRPRRADHRCLPWPFADLCSQLCGHEHADRISDRKPPAAMHAVGMPAGRETLASTWQRAPVNWEREAIWLQQCSAAPTSAVAWSSGTSGNRADAIHSTGHRATLKRLQTGVVHLVFVRIKTG